MYEQSQSGEERGGAVKLICCLCAADSQQGEAREVMFIAGRSGWDWFTGSFKTRMAFCPRCAKSKRHGELLALSRQPNPSAPVDYCI